jgi:MFS family permease
MARNYKEWLSLSHVHSYGSGAYSLLSASFRRVLPAYLTLLLWHTAWSITVTGPVLPLYIEAIGIGIIGWSELSAVFALGMFLFEWVWGSLSDRIGRPFLMIASTLCMSLLFVLYASHGSFAFFMVLQLLSGAFGVIIAPTTRAYVSEESTGRSAGLYAGLWWVFFSLGRVIGPLIGTYIAQTWSFEYSFYASSALSILTFFIIFMTFPRDRRGGGEARGITEGLKTVGRSRSTRLLFLSAVFAFIGVSIVSSFLPLYASGQVGMSTVEVGTLVAMISAAQLVAMPLVGWLADRFGRKRTATVGFFLSSCSFLLYFLAHTSYQVFLVSIALGLGLSVISLLLAIIPDVTPSRMYGTVVGLYGSSEDLGIIVGPLVYGFVWSVSSPVYIFAASSISQILSAVLVYALGQDNLQEAKAAYAR